MAFSRFRPTSHFIAPHSWSNDPCGAVFIPETQEYLLCYQWYPGKTTAGNSAWGMARSQDMITWRDCSPPIQNGTETKYDSQGVFSGSIVSRMIEGKRVLFLFYTSVSALPIHWSREYLQGETQSVAFSTDLGTSWERYMKNPVLRVAPAKSESTGWRDPFVSQWSSLSYLRKKSLNTNYMMISSGKKGSGPQIHLYESDDLLGWSMVSTILSVPTDARVSAESELSWGRNFECTSFFTLNGREYIVVCIEEDTSSKRHCSRYTMWMSGRMILDAQSNPRFQMQSHGLLDHGILYAPHLFRGENNTLLQLGWADEDILEQRHIEAQGWAGCLTHPRELFEIEAPMLSENTPGHSWLATSSSAMTTLGIRPARQTQGLRPGSKFHSTSTFPNIHSKNFELLIGINGASLCGDECIIFNVRQAPNDREVTRVIISLPTDSIIVDRSKSSLGIGNLSPDEGKFSLLRTQHGYEDLKIHIFLDNSILEVFVNERFALTSRIYPTLDTSMGASHDFGGIPESQISFQCWEGLKNAWPERDGPREALKGAESKNLDSFAHIETAEVALPTAVIG